MQFFLEETRRDEKRGHDVHYSTPLPLTVGQVRASSIIQPKHFIDLRN